jgi:hypothetical protein
MGEQARQALFISHASPEDNAFTLWLGAKLTALGYEVFADVLRLKGGDDWERILESAIRDKAAKFLLVATPHGVQKQGVRNEITIATDTARRIGDKSFIIPLRLAPFDAPLQIAHAQYIDFSKGWALGLSDLLPLLAEAVTLQPGGKTNADLCTSRKLDIRYTVAVLRREVEMSKIRVGQGVTTGVLAKHWPRADSYAGPRNGSTLASTTPTEAPGKSFRTFVDAALAQNEGGKRFGVCLVLCCVPQHARPLGSRSLI